LIKTVGDFLNRLREAESEALARQKVEHAPTIGDMYEGLTQSILSRALPAGSGLEVSAGFIKDDSSELSDELDCLVVTAPGEQVPYTNKRVFHIDDVVAVVQVKKNLYSKDLKSGYENLASVNRLNPVRDREGSLFSHAYRATTLSLPPQPEDYRRVLPHDLQVVYYTLGMECYYPVRIVLGYNGFKTESALRNSFYSFLENQLDERGHATGFGVHRFPNLICCGGHSLVKGNGMPFCCPIDEDGYWPFYCSTSANPTELILEVIWTRLVYESRLSGSVFDDDAHLTPMNRFIDARPLTGGWEYRIMDVPKEIVDAPPEAREWRPAFLDETQFAVILLLASEESIDPEDSALVELIRGTEYTVESLVDSLRALRLATVDGGRIVFLTTQCECLLLPDGRIAAADNRAGELTRWLARAFAPGEVVATEETS